MQAIPYTNNMSWGVFDIETGVLLNNFVSPCDVLIDNLKFSYGYSVEIFGKPAKSEYCVISPLNYMFDYYSGILTFNPQFDVTQYTEIYFSGFRYIGKNLNSKLDSLIDIEKFKTEIINAVLLELML